MIELVNVPYEALKLPTKIKIKDLTCCCCGNRTKGRQWWNRDTGFGLCTPCSVSISKKEDKEEMKNCYGEEGFHYAIDEGKNEFI